MVGKQISLGKIFNARADHMEPGVNAKMATAFRGGKSQADLIRDKLKQVDRLIASYDAKKSASSEKKKQLAARRNKMGRLSVEFAKELKKWQHKQLELAAKTRAIAKEIEKLLK